MSIYNDWYPSQENKIYKKEGYKRQKQEIKEINPDDYMLVNIEGGGTVNITRCSHVENGIRCNNPGTISLSGAGWACSKHCRG